MFVCLCVCVCVCVHVCVCVCVCKSIHYLTSVCLALKTWGPQLQLSDIAFGPRYIVSRSASGFSTHERDCNLTRKG